MGDIPKDIEAFRREMREMREIYEQRFAELDEKYKEDSSPRGLDDRPGADEYNALTRQMFADIHRVRRKYGFKQ